jgi:hypothetical protein
MVVWWEERFPLLLLLLQPQVWRVWSQPSHTKT